MTITSDRVSPVIDEPDVDLLPGSADVEWAERAYRQRPALPSAPPRSAIRSAGRRLHHHLRRIVAAFVLVAAMIVVLTTQSAWSPTSRPAVSKPTATVPSTRTPAGHLSLTPPLLRPPAFSIPILTAPEH
jgi:hypothetical protein